MEVIETEETCPLAGLDFSAGSGRKNRKLQLIADFSDGYAKNWFFAVSTAFRDQLDIRYTDRSTTSIQKDENGKSVKIKTLFKEWTQGRYFCFAEGHVVYDTPKASLVWSEAMQHIQYACQVIQGTANRMARYAEDSSHEHSLETLSGNPTTDDPAMLDNETGNDGDSEGTGTRFIEGQVHFQLLVPDGQRKNLMVKDSFHASQREFVLFLKTGKFRGVPIEDLLANSPSQGDA